MMGRGMRLTQLLELNTDVQIHDCDDDHDGMLMMVMIYDMVTIMRETITFCSLIIFLSGQSRKRKKKSTSSAAR